MSLSVNLRHLAEHGLHLKGELPAEELDIETADEMIQVDKPLEYDLEIEKLESGLLLQGTLKLPLQCKCVRCLKPFEHVVRLRHHTLHLPLQGEEARPVINDCLDLTPVIREDILLEFPQHPLCDPDCPGLPNFNSDRSSRDIGADQTEASSPTWAELNKLKFKP